MSNVLVITTSLRAKSNSDILAERLTAGARDAGHQGKKEEQDEAYQFGLSLK